MPERTQLTNLFLLCVLTGILLVSGSLQCAFDCLTLADAPRNVSLFSSAERVDACHLDIEYTAPTASCMNKACHKRLPYQRDLGGPAIYQLQKLAHPIYSNTRQTEPQYRAGSIIETPRVDSQTESTLYSASTNILPQTLHSIRTTVLLC